MPKESFDKKKYGGKYIATEAFESYEVIASGDDPVEVYAEAIENGVEDPVINFIHKEGCLCLY